MEVEVNELWGERRTYILKSVEDCKDDSTLKSIYELVVETNDVITMGQFVALPVSKYKYWGK